MSDPGQRFLAEDVFLFLRFTRASSVLPAHVSGRKFVFMMSALQRRLYKRIHRDSFGHKEKKYILIKMFLRATFNVVR